ncbi:hypothetical protein GCM10009646_84610 [Streptomyces aureus]
MVAEHFHAHRLLPGERVVRGHHQVERFLAQHRSDGWFVLEVSDHAEAIELTRGFPTPEALEIRPLLESA